MWGMSTSHLFREPGQKKIPTRPSNPGQEYPEKTRNAMNFKLSIQQVSNSGMIKGFCRFPAVSLISLQSLSRQPLFVVEVFDIKNEHYQKAECLLWSSLLQ
jgi:hypothetical protein